MQVLRLRVISVNDVYSLENLPRLKNLVAHRVATDPADAVLVVIAGDFVAPTLLSALDAGRGMVDCLHEIGITHACLGNHENDIPAAELHARVHELRAAWLSTNVPFDPVMPRRAVVEVARGEARVRVGLVGVVMNDAFVTHGEAFGGAPIEPPVPAALAEAARLLRDEHCDCIVALTHQPLPDDRRLAEQAAAAGIPLPLIVGGHEHVPFLEQASRSQIVKSGMDAAAACISELVWNGGGIPAVTARREPVAGYPEDAALRARVDAHMAKLGAIADTTIVALAPGATLSSIGARSQQTTFGTLVCSRLRDALRADACVLNGGGIRGAREYRTRLTYADLRTEMPFRNELVVAPLPGGVVRDAIAASRARAPQEHGGFLQVDDGIAVEGTTVTAIAGAPIDDEREYRVALVRDLFAGLDHIEPLERFAREHPDRIPPPTTGRDIRHFLVEAFGGELGRTSAGFAPRHTGEQA
ncbi:MAG: 5'-nucleotidase C-terminal domain-containing protein [Acidobacteriota bacterium]